MQAKPETPAKAEELTFAAAFQHRLRAVDEAYTEMRRLIGDPDFVDYSSASYKTLKEQFDDAVEDVCRIKSLWNETRKRMAF